MDSWARYPPGTLERSMCSDATRAQTRNASALFPRPPSGPAEDTTRIVPCLRYGPRCDVIGGEVVTTLVTGAAGHLGLTLVQLLLERGETVRALDLRPTDQLRALPVEVVQADVTDSSALSAAFVGVDRVFHTAALISLAMDQWPQLEAVNVEGVRQVVNQCRAHGVRRLVHFSSIEALNLEGEGPVSEDTPLVTEQFPIPYGRSKAMGQRIVLEAVRDGLDAVVCYPTGILGPNDYALNASNQALLRLRDGEPWVMVDAGLDWVDVRDVAAGALAAADRAPAGASYLLGGRYATVEQLQAIIRELTGAKLPSRRITLRQVEWLLPLVGLQSRLTRRPPALTKAMLYPLKHGGQVNRSRAAQELGYAPRPLEETIADALSWFDEVGVSTAPPISRPPT
jgi:dihydroflavonol-4-reductase